MIRKEFLIVVAAITIVFAVAYFEITPVRSMMDWRAVVNATSVKEVSLSDYQVYDHTDGKESELTIDFQKGKHFWNPQVAIWLEDSTGKYLETLLVTTSTAKGIFYSGRTAQNFKESDEKKADENASVRKVDALPYWSHKRGHKYSDGFYSPPPGEPLPDAVTGATPKDNFYFQSPISLNDLEAFKILVEVNVAFDENEHYSEYDFLEDSVYHSGTGLLGQPSIIYSATIRKSDLNRYYILSTAGHGHRSGASGDLITEMNSITTARYIVERIVVGVNEKWYQK